MLFRALHRIARAVGRLVAVAVMAYRSELARLQAEQRSQQFPREPRPVPLDDDEQAAQQILDAHTLRDALHRALHRYSPRQEPPQA